ncbi:MAG TPA: UDP-N-acetylmuramoyl-L-alanyl-D-glutamate--2,6-diaminopimelate ligase, partial [Actinomycetales bacterium]
MPTPAGLRPSLAPGSSLDALVAEVGGLALVPPTSGDLLVTGVTLDSRVVRPGDLYAALPGSTAHGADFAEQARAAGAVALLTDTEGQRRAAGVLPALVGERPRAVLGAIASAVYGHPSRDLLVLGVTGTNGKTTTTYLLDAALRATGRVTGMIGTVETRVADERVPSVRTTPEAPDLHRLLATMREREVAVCSMEISSQALAQHRVDGVVVDVAGFTSFSQDHLELHGDMRTYLAAKALLFTPAHSRRGVVVVDDEGGREVAATAGVPVTTVSAHAGAGADWVVTDPVPSGPTTTFVLAHRDGGPALALRCPLPGDFNVMNTAVAAVMLLTAGLGPDEVAQGLGQAGGVPGRMEQVGAGEAGEPLAVVDYAHTPDAVAAALEALRHNVSAAGRMVIVLGAGGDRDPGKRAGMGAAAAQHAHVVVVTDDNPRSEPPGAIRAAVLAGARERAAA